MKGRVPILHVLPHSLYKHQSPGMTTVIPVQQSQKLTHLSLAAHRNDPLTSSTTPHTTAARHCTPSTQVRHLAAAQDTEHSHLGERLNTGGLKEPAEPQQPPPLYARDPGPTRQKHASRAALYASTWSNRFALSSCLVQRRAWTRSFAQAWDFTYPGMYGGSTPGEWIQGDEGVYARGRAHRGDGGGEEETVHMADPRVPYWLAARCWRYRASERRRGNAWPSQNAEAYDPDPCSHCSPLYPKLASQPQASA